MYISSYFLFSCHPIYLPLFLFANHIISYYLRLLLDMYQCREDRHYELKTLKFINKCSCPKCIVPLIQNPIDQILNGVLCRKGVEDFQPPSTSSFDNHDNNNNNNSDDNSNVNSTPDKSSDNNTNNKSSKQKKNHNNNNTTGHPTTNKCKGIYYRTENYTLLNEILSSHGVGTIKLPTKKSDSDGGENGYVKCNECGHKLSTEELRKIDRYIPFVIEIDITYIRGSPI